MCLLENVSKVKFVQSDNDVAYCIVTSRIKILTERKQNVGLIDITKII